MSSVEKADAWPASDFSHNYLPDFYFLIGNTKSYTKMQNYATKLLYH